MNRYEHTETGWIIIAFTGGALVLSLAVSAATGRCDPAFVVYGVPAVLLAALLCFFRMTVAVDGEAVRLRLGAGLIRLSLPLADIVSAGSVRAPWYSGWGIRYIGGGWLYAVNSHDVVELKLKNGRRYMIGTNDRDNLLAAILAGLNG